MYLEQQINAIVRTCFTEGVKANEVQTVVKAFYNGRVPSTNIMVLAIADTYGVSFGDIQQEETKKRTLDMIAQLREG